VPNGLTPKTPVSWRIGSEATPSPFSAGAHTVRRDSHTLLDQTSAELLRASQRVSELESELHRAHASVSNYEAEFELRMEQSEALAQEVMQLQSELLVRDADLRALQAAGQPPAQASGTDGLPQQLTVCHERIALLEDTLHQLRPDR
jgi:capsule polysaccharide export protein KpsE/RkpR